MICLDSSFLIDVLNNKESAIKKLKEIKDEKAIATSISEYELLNGAYLKNYSKVKIENIVSLFNGIQVYFFDSNAALIASRIYSELIKEGKEIDDRDCMIAGIAISNGCKEIITKNTKHFERINGIKAVSY